MTKNKNKIKNKKRAIKPKIKTKVKIKKHGFLKYKIKTNKHKKRKKNVKSLKSISIPFDFGNISPDRERVVVLVVSIIFVLTGMYFLNIIGMGKSDQVHVAFAAKKNAALERDIKKMVDGYPIAKMSSYISEKDPKTAVFLIAIAKKESGWGKHAPVLKGEDCYNYWGFRLKSDRMGSGGHTCFDSPKEAVDIVATRIDELIKEEKIDTPKEMVVWKCGSDCIATGGQEAANKWIRDVGFYYNKFSSYL